MYIDQRWMQAVDQGVTQFVIVAAGLDTRAWRLPNLDNHKSPVKIFEVDVSRAFEYKRDILAEVKRLILGSEQDSPSPSPKESRFKIHPIWLEEFSREFLLATQRGKAFAKDLAQMLRTRNPNSPGPASPSNLHNSNRQPPSRTRIEVPGDLANTNWAQALIEAGFDPSQKCFCVMEGLLPYLPGKAVPKLLNAVGNILLAPGSELIGDANIDAEEFTYAA